MKEQLSPFMPNLTLPLVKSEILYAEEDRPSNNISPLASNPSVAQMPVNNRLEETVNEIEVLLKQQRKEVERLLAQEDSLDKETKIELFLKNSFHEIRHIIKSRLAEHQALVDALRSGRLNYRQASQQSEALQEKLAPFFKKKVFLLFHPDKYDSANGPIKQILDALFIQIKNLYETSIAQLLEGIEIIQQANDREEKHEEMLQKSRDFYRDILNKFITVYEEYAQKATAMYKEMEVQMKEHHAEIQMHHAEIQAHHAEIQMHHADIKVMYADMEARIGADRDKVKARMQELERQFRARMVLPQHQAAASDNETAAATGHSFFLAGR